VASVVNLIRAYERFISLEWTPNLAGPQKVLFAVYDPRDERRIRARLGEFENATRRAGRAWVPCDLTQAFAQWMSNHKYREAYFEDPESMEIALSDFENYTAKTVMTSLQDPHADERSVVAVYGAASLFGFMKVSRLIELVEDAIPGRLLLFFPGQHDDGVYRLMDARDGWNYHAVPISSE
jgi:hypothetical protein